MDDCKTILSDYPDKMKRTITGDETWIYAYAIWANIVPKVSQMHGHCVTRPLRYRVRVCPYVSPWIVLWSSVSSCRLRDSRKQCCPSLDYRHLADSVIGSPHLSRIEIENMSSGNGYYLCGLLCFLFVTENAKITETRWGWKRDPREATSCEFNAEYGNYHAMEQQSAQNRI